MNYELSISKLSDYGKLYGIMVSNEIEPGDNLRIDLKEHIMIKPVHVIILTMGVIQLVNKEVLIDVYLPEKDKQRDFLLGIEFEKFCNANMTTSNTVSDISIKNALPLRRVNTEHLNDYILEALAYFGVHCANKDTSMLDLSIAELINNVYDHAGSAIDAYIFSQYSPKKKRINIVVGDFGIGIPAKANKYFEDESIPAKSSEECIKWALALNQSSFSKPHNKGKGLNNIYSFVKASDSRLRIFSNDVVFECKGTEEEIYSNNLINDFRGTVVEVEINIDGLADEDLTLKSLWD